MNSLCSPTVRQGVCVCVCVHLATFPHPFGLLVVEVSLYAGLSSGYQHCVPDSQAPKSYSHHTKMTSRRFKKKKKSFIAKQPMTTHTQYCGAELLPPLGNNVLLTWNYYAFFKITV